MQKKINSLIIGVIGLLLVILGFYYYQKNINVVILEEQNVVPEETNTPTIAEKNKIAESSLNAEEIKAQEALKTAKWNTAMHNAVLASGRGEYDKAISYYNEALSYYKKDTVYSGLFVAYSAKDDKENAQVAIEKAIKLNPFFAEYWKTKLIFLDEKTDTSFADLKRIYEEGLLKVDPATKIDLVTHFAVIAESNWQKSEAIAVWEYAKTLFSENSSIYQAEIDRLQKVN